VPLLDITRPSGRANLTLIIFERSLKMAFSKSVAFGLIGVAVCNGAFCAQEYRPAVNSSSEQRVVLPLDHGPHAVTTPWLNRQKLISSSQVDKQHAAVTVTPRLPSDSIERRP
jgi:hypothetical protein